MAVDATNPTPALETEPGADVQPDPIAVVPTEEQASGDPGQTPEEAAAAAQQAAEDLADIEKPVEPRTWLFEGDFNLKRGDKLIPQHFRGEYTQKPLSYLAFLEFTGLLAAKIEEAMRGEDGLTIKEVIESTESAMPFIVDGDRIEAVVEKRDFDGIDAFVKGLMKLASYVPDVIEECQFIWLRVPRRDRVFLREIWNRSLDDGGLSHDEGEEMLSLFIEQNYEELENFFGERLPRMGRVARIARMRTAKNRDESPEGSRRSRPWSRTQEDTPSQ